MQHVNALYTAKIDEVYSHLRKTIPNFQPTQEFIDGLLNAIMLKDTREFKRKMNYLAASEASRHSYLRVIQRQSMDASISPELHHPHPDIVRPVTPPPLQINRDEVHEDPIVPHNTPIVKYLQYPILEEEELQELPLDQEVDELQEEELDQELDQELDEESYEAAWYSHDMLQYYD